MSQPDPQTETAYVVGFMFSPDLEKVALIRKKRPAWQAGLLNGIGGKIEALEPPAVAMAREFLEETGSRTHPGEWKHYHTMSGADRDGRAFRVEFFFATGDVVRLRTMEDEVVTVKLVHNVISTNRDDVVDNLCWILALALNVLKDGRPSFSTSTYS